MLRMVSSPERANRGLRAWPAFAYFAVTCLAMLLFVAPCLLSAANSPTPSTQTPVCPLKKDRSVTEATGPSSLVEDEYDDDDEKVTVLVAIPQGFHVSLTAPQPPDSLDRSISTNVYRPLRC